MNPRLTDAEWEMRVGRAIYVLTSTLPDFFASGLIMNASHDDSIDVEESIYSRDIVLSYRPPTRLPAPFPDTLRIQGLSLYQGSAVLLKSSFTTLYSDCSVTLERMNIMPCGTRERKIRIDLNMHGTARLSSTTSTWNVSSTYHFSPSSGLIYKHDIESIYPEPHSAVFESMQNTLLRLTGIKPRTPEGAENLEGFKVPIHSRDHTSYPQLRPRNYR